MFAWRQGVGRGTVLGLAAGFAAGALVGLGLWAGAYLALTNSPSSAFSELPVFAAATHGGQQFAMCTGPIDDKVEGVYFLDFITGDLVCYVMNPRMHKLSAMFKVNIANDFGVDKTKQPKYLICTGNYAGTQGATTAKPALSVVYVLDENSGEFAVYGVPLPQGFSSNYQITDGTLMKLGAGKARTTKIN